MVPCYVLRNGGLCQRFVFRVRSVGGLVRQIYHGRHVDQVSEVECGPGQEEGS